MWGRRRSDWGFILLLCSGAAWAWVLGGIVGVVGAFVLMVCIRASLARKRPVVYDVNVRLTDALGILGNRCAVGLCMTVRLPADTLTAHDGLVQLKKTISKHDIAVHTDFGHYIVFMRLDRHLSRAQCLKIARRVSVFARDQRAASVGYSYGIHTAPSLLLKQAVMAMNSGSDDTIHGTYCSENSGKRSQRVGFMQRNF